MEILIFRFISLRLFFTTVNKTETLKKFTFKFTRNKQQVETFYLWEPLVFRDWNVHVLFLCLHRVMNSIDGFRLLYASQPDLRNKKFINLYKIEVFVFLTSDENSVEQKTQPFLSVIPSGNGVFSCL